ncbi:hypothetical protein, partial [Streptomyces filamentosus]|uniref:hypothetical protein n=1 Tax=Streptomyces filamentosus TaxID=67294 RepID=UPI001E302C01
VVARGGVLALASGAVISLWMNSSVRLTACGRLGLAGLVGELDGVALMTEPFQVVEWVVIG